MEKVPKKYRKFVSSVCEKYDIYENVLIELISVESQWVATAKGRMNGNGSFDIGFGQLNSFNMGWFSTVFYENTGKKFDPYNPFHNIEICAWYISSLIKEHGNISFALCAYNAGSGAVKKNSIPRSTMVYMNKIMYSAFM